MGVYGASKHAAVGLARTLDAEVGARGVRVTVICPMFVDTPIVRRSATVGVNPEALVAAYGLPVMPVEARGRLVASMPFAARALLALDRLAPWLTRLLMRAVARKIVAAR